LRGAIFLAHAKLVWNEKGITMFLLFESRDLFYYPVFKFCNCKFLRLLDMYILSRLEIARKNIIIASSLLDIWI